MENQPIVESVLVEMTATPDGRATFTLQATTLQLDQAQTWERIILILQGGLRAAILQTAAPQPEAPRIVTPGFVLPPSSGH